MQIEDQDEEIQETGCWCCSCCRGEATNPDLTSRSLCKSDLYVKKPYLETGYLVPFTKRTGTGKSLEALRRENASTRNLPYPEESIQKTNSKRSSKDSGQPYLERMDVADVNNLLRRRLSLRVLVTDEDQSGERGEALLPKRTIFTDAAPILLSHLVKGSTATGDSYRKSTTRLDQLRSSFSFSKSPEEATPHTHRVGETSNIEQKTDKEFLDYLLKTSQFMKEALEKDWYKTKSYVRWIDTYVKSNRFAEKARTSPDKWMVVLYTSSEDSFDQMTNFRCMLVRLLLQHYYIVYEERDITLPQFEAEFQDRLLGDTLNIPQVYMQGLNIGGYRVMYAIHKLGLAPSIFRKFIMAPQGYAEWMFKKENVSATLSLDVNLKAFPALQALAGSWSNDKLSPAHLEFVNLGKFVVKLGRERWYHLSSRPHIEPDLRRYALLRLTIIQALCAMNKVYKQYLNKIDTDGGNKLRRKLSWLPRFSKQMSKD